MEKTKSGPIWSVIEYARRAVTPFVINLMFGMTMFACAAIENDEARIILSYLLLVLTYIASFVLIRTMGENAYKMKVAGERKRKGQPLGLTDSKDAYWPAKEYRGYKGFVIGAVVSLIPIVFIVIDAAAGVSGVRVACAMLAGWAFFPPVVIATSANILFSLIPCAIQIVVAGVAYIMGGNKEKLRQFALEQREADVSKAKGEKKR